MTREKESIDFAAWITNRYNRFGKDKKQNLQAVRELYKEYLKLITLILVLCPFFSIGQVSVPDPSELGKIFVVMDGDTINTVDTVIYRSGKVRLIIGEMPIPVPVSLRWWAIDLYLGQHCGHADVGALNNMPRRGAYICGNCGRFIPIR